MVHFEVDELILLSITSHCSQLIEHLMHSFLFESKLYPSLQEKRENLFSKVGSLILENELQF